MNEKIVELIKEENNYSCIICGSADNVYIMTYSTTKSRGFFLRKPQLTSRLSLKAGHFGICNFQS